MINSAHVQLPRLGVARHVPFEHAKLRGREVEVQRRDETPGDRVVQRQQAIAADREIVLEDRARRHDIDEVRGHPQHAVLVHVLSSQDGIRFDVLRGLSGIDLLIHVLVTAEDGVTRSVRICPSRVLIVSASE